MLLIQHKTIIDRLLLMALALFWFSHSSVADEKSENIEHPTLANWYQVEVVLFDQKSILGDEQAPKEHSLEFPSRWIELHSRYQNTGIMRRPLFDRLSKASLTEPNQASLVDRIYADLGIPYFRYIMESQSYLNLVPEARIPYQANNAPEPQSTQIDQQSELDFYEEDTVEDKLADTNSPSDFKPIFEAPFRILNKKERDLNDTARALNRRKYNVLFHQAWRFPVTSKENSDWILLKVGDEQAGRYRIEGALRFYKSRFLHFETNLWKFVFNNSLEKIKLPDIPEKEPTSEEAILIKALDFSNNYLALTDIPHKEPTLVQEGLNGYNIDAITHLIKSNKTETAITSQQDSKDQYPIQAIWPIKQSKRIQEEEVYYIDHPQMGALVTIKPYQPVPINLPVIEPGKTEEQAEESNN